MKKMLLYLIALVCVHISNVWSDETFYLHQKDLDNNFDVTTIYRITNFSDFKNSDFAGFKESYFLRNHKGSYSVEVYSRTNAIGIPLQNDYDVLKTNVNAIINNGSINDKSCCHESVSFNSDKWRTANFINFGKTYVALEFSGYNSYYDNDLKQIMSLTWVPKKDQTCFTITYIHNTNSLLNIVYLRISDTEDKLISTTTLIKQEYMTTLKIKNIALLKDKTYNISLYMKLSYRYERYHHTRYDGQWFGLIQLAQCSNYGGVDGYIVDNVEKEFPVPINILGYDENNSLSPTGSCLNGGHQKSYSNLMCVCPPGFIGTYCETGCGSNKFGNDCKGVCSLDSSKCRGILMCTGYGCVCPTGLTGPICDGDCPLGTYGNNCKQLCSNNCYKNSCDGYTGKCTHGCLTGYVPPSCQKKYPSLINPPRLISNDYNSIEIELNFQPDNINGDGSLPLKYYQLFYESPNEDNITKSEFKLITNNQNKITDILTGLKADTTYNIGVLIITDDGNSNDQDIVYGRITTPCIQPQITEHNVKVESGIKMVNITWNKIKTEPSECRVVEYSLTLICDELHDQMLEDKIIKLSSTYDNYIIQDLFPGYQYSIIMTPKTSKGQLPSSTSFSFSPLAQENDIKIKDIATTIKGKNIKVTWRLEYDELVYVNNPIAIAIRYRICRVLSCSLKELENDWTSITVYNQTDYEIVDTVSHAQYCIQVVNAAEDINRIERKNLVYALTPASSPTIEPNFDSEHPIVVTNSSVFLQWKFNLSDCVQLNGFYSKFYIELQSDNDTLKLKKTEDNHVTFENLKSSCAYEVKVFVENHLGYNRNRFLVKNFTTKSENLGPVDDLMVYKKSLKSRMAGLRWSYVENTNLNGYFVSIDEKDNKNDQNYSVIHPNKCNAWPEYYCHTFDHLTASKSYTFKIMPISIDYPEGGKMSSITFNSIDGLPDPPKNLKSNEINSTSVNLSWDIPWILNGVLEEFIINVEEISASNMDTCCASISPIDITVDEELPTYNYTITDLKPGSTYSIGVLSVSKSLWYSSPARTSVTTLI